MRVKGVIDNAIIILQPFKAGNVAGRQRIMCIAYIYPIDVVSENIGNEM
jgi:hypothetical protein